MITCSQLSPKVVGVHGLRSDFGENPVEVRGAFVADRIHPHEPVVWVRFPKTLGADTEFVQVGIVPPQRRLQTTEWRSSSAKPEGTSNRRQIGGLV